MKTCDSSYVGAMCGDSGVSADGGTAAAVAGDKRPLIIPDGADVAASPILPEGPLLMRRRLNFE